MELQRRLENKKYRQWVKAGLSLYYFKEGLSPFCHDVANQQYKDILDEAAVTCGQCDMSKVKKGNNACPNNVCDAIFDKIKTELVPTHVPNWKNANPKKSIKDAWSMAKCFIHTPGYEEKTSAADTDCTGLLHVIINNKYFHKHITEPDTFIKVRQYRNKIFHSSSMELEEADTNTYIDDMIAVLQDGKELINKKYAQDAVKTLQELKSKDFFITTENELKLIRDIAEGIQDLPTKDDFESLKKKLSDIESVISDQMEYEKSKSDLKAKLIKLYREDTLRVSAMPLQQESDLNDFEDVYTRPRMTIAPKKDKQKDKKEDKMENEAEVDVQLMSDIFTKNGESIKSVYVIGEAGSGKTSFCKSLINYWCLAHSDEGQSIEDKFDGVKEMKKFEYLFYLPLRHNANKATIKEMLEKNYQHPALDKLLKCESRTCLIVLDGLDEYQSSKGPIRSPAKSDPFKDYTVITTSRPWKIATLGITDNDIRQKIVLKGFDDTTYEQNLIEKTVPILNNTFEKDKNPSDCEEALLAKESLASLKHTAIMLQQLICLWFDDRLSGRISRCALYTEMLDMFFYWNTKKWSDGLSLSKPENVELPDYFNGTEVCKSYSNIIHNVSLLAYETLFCNPKEASLSFDSFTFERLKISDEVKLSCLKLGILSEDKCPGLSASKSRKSVTAFVHKSFQEYLAAVYIAIKFKARIVSSDDSGNVDLSDTSAKFVQNLFSKCKNLDEILEQANVFIMLCGLEPRIATSISKFIYNIVAKDERVQKYRRTIDFEESHEQLISDIHECIVNCIDEVKACGTSVQPSFDLGDLVGICIDTDHFERQIISPDSVISCRISEHNTNKSLPVLLKYQRLEAIHIFILNCFMVDDEGIKYICDAIENNTSTLKSLLVVQGVMRHIDMGLVYRTIVHRLPDMSHLVALRIGDGGIQHEDFISLCTFLSGSSQLKQIAISRIHCKYNIGRERNRRSEPSTVSAPSTVSESSTGSERSTIRLFLDQHEVDLSKHQQLQYLEYDYSVTVTRVNTSNLEIFKCYSLNHTNVEIFDNLSTANKLTELCIWNDIRSDKTSSYHSVTYKLITMLPLLQQLCELTLDSYTLTDNIMKFPSEMKSMKITVLNNIRMSLTTWRQFVDSLPLIPLPVEVKTWAMCITRDGEEYNPDISWLNGGGGEELAARQYVRQQEALFNVEYEGKLFFFNKK